ncbi:MAG: ApeP family dehydratase [Gammaproteobacteria bacterium]
MKKWHDFAINELLPHADKMMLLERLIEYEPEFLVTEVRVRDDGLFGNGVTVPAWLGIEYMAQTIAALGGLQRKMAGQEIELGFLLGTRRYQCNVDSFAVDTVLTIDVKRLIQDQGLGVFDCHIKGKGIKGSANLNVYQPDSATNRVFPD